MWERDSSSNVLQIWLERRPFKVLLKRRLHLAIIPHRRLLIRPAITVHSAIKSSCFSKELKIPILNPAFYCNMCLYVYGEKAPLCHTSWCNIHFNMGTLHLCAITTLWDSLIWTHCAHVSLYWNIWLNVGTMHPRSLALWCKMHFNMGLCAFLPLHPDTCDHRDLIWAN
jgi:hypothetical protein